MRPGSNHQSRAVGALYTDKDQVKQGEPIGIAFTNDMREGVV
jgi:hypothetical protein